jgi:hypothetical protein
VSFTREVCNYLKEADCSFVRDGKGEHDIWYSPITNCDVTVDHKILSRHGNG